MLAAAVPAAGSVVFAASTEIALATALRRPASGGYREKRGVALVAAAGSAAGSVVFAESTEIAFATALRRPASGGYRESPALRW